MQVLWAQQLLHSTETLKVWGQSKSFKAQSFNCGPVIYSERTHWDELLSFTIMWQTPWHCTECDELQPHTLTVIQALFITAVAEHLKTENLLHHCTPFVKSTARISFCLHCSLLVFIWVEWVECQIASKSLKACPKSDPEILETYPFGKSDFEQ